jgi:capsular polysaccharide transport system permease protein
MSDNIPRRIQKNALEGQLRVIHALVIREMLTRFGASRLGYLWLVGEPAMLAFGVSTIHWASGHSIGNNIPPFLFYGLGYAPFFMFRSIFTRNASAVVASRSLLFHRSIALHDICISRSLVEFVAIVPIVAIFVVIGLFYMEVWPSNLGVMMLALCLSAVLSHGFGCLIGALVVFYEPLERITHPLTYLMMPLSGAFFMVESMPPELQSAFLWVPLVHVHEMFRDGMWGGKIISHYSISYVLLWILAVNLLGMAALRVSRQKVSLSH